MNMRELLKERYGKEHLSYSSLKQALGDMRQFEMYMRGTLYKTSDALHFGSLYDCLLLTPSEAPKVYTILDEQEFTEGIGGKKPKQTREYAQRVEEFSKLAKAEGKQVVTSSDWQKAVDMIDRMSDEGLLDECLSLGQPQVEFNEDLEVNGVMIPLKGFIDYLHPDYVLDSKSTRSIDKFRYDVNSFCYDIQAYIYTLVTGKKEFYWLAQEKTEPYYPALIRCSEKTLFNGEMKFNEAVSNVITWLDTPEAEVNGVARFEI